MKELRYDTMKAAIDGDAIAINQIVDYFRPYICRLSTKSISNCNGDTQYMNDDIRRELETYLIAQIMQFKIQE